MSDDLEFQDNSDLTETNTSELAREKTKETAIFHEPVDIFLYVLALAFDFCC